MNSNQEINENSIKDFDALKFYLLEISQIPLLTFEEEIYYGQKLKMIENSAIILNNEGKRKLDIQKIVAYICSQKFSPNIIDKIKRIISLQPPNFYNNINLLNELETILNIQEIECKNNRIKLFAELNNIIIIPNELNLDEELNKYSEYNDAFDIFVKSNQKLVISIAKNLMKFAPNLDLIDLINEGNVGLIKATTKFDSDKGYKFSTYATWWIKQHITRYIYSCNNSIKTSNHVKINAIKFQQKVDDLERKYNRTLTIKELSNELNISYKTIYEYFIILNPVTSLDTKINEDDDFTLIDNLMDQNSINMQEEICQSMLKEDITVLFENLTLRELLVIKYRFGIDQIDNKQFTLDYLSQLFNVSPETIRQIEYTAIKKMRMTLKRNSNAKCLKIYIS